MKLGSHSHVFFVTGILLLILSFTTGCVNIDVKPYVYLTISEKGEITKYQIDLIMTEDEYQLLKLMANSQNDNSLISLIGDKMKESYGISFSGQLKKEGTDRIISYTASNIHNKVKGVEVSIFSGIIDCKISPVDIIELIGSSQNSISSIHVTLIMPDSITSTNSESYNQNQAAWALQAGEYNTELSASCKVPQKTGKSLFGSVNQNPKEKGSVLSIFNKKPRKQTESELGKNILGSLFRTDDPTKSVSQEARIYSLSPSEVYDSDSSLKVIIKGINFKSGSIPKIGSVIGTEIKVNQGSSIVANFDISNLKAGTYDVSIIYPDGTQISKPNAFHIMPIKISEVSISGIFPSTTVIGTDPFIARIEGTGFKKAKKINAIRLDDGSGHVYDAFLGTIKTDTIITGIPFNLATAQVGKYYVMVSNDMGETWISSKKPLLTITSPLPGKFSFTPDTAVTGTKKFEIMVKGDGLEKVNGACIDNKKGTLINSEKLDMWYKHSASIYPPLNKNLYYDFDLSNVPPGRYYVMLSEDYEKSWVYSSENFLTVTGPWIEEISPNSLGMGTNPLVEITGSGFVTGGKINKIALDDQKNHKYVSKNIADVTDTKIKGIEFDLSSAVSGIYNVIMSRDNGKTWFPYESKPWVEIETVIPDITNIDPITLDYAENESGAIKISGKNFINPITLSLTNWKNPSVKYKGNYALRSDLAIFYIEPDDVVSGEWNLQISNPGGGSSRNHQIIIKKSFKEKTRDFFNGLIN